MIVNQKKKNGDIDMFESASDILDPGVTEEKVVTNSQIANVSTNLPSNVIGQSSEESKQYGLSPRKLLSFHELENEAHSRQSRAASNATVVIHEDKGELRKMTDEIITFNSLNVTASPNDNKEDSVRIKHEMKEMSYWNLPASGLKEYEKKGVTRMFDWQVECLLTTKVLSRCCNLIYCAPTSAATMYGNNH